LATPEDSVLTLFEHVLALKRLPRTGWLLAGVPRAESIADHTFGTATLAGLMCDLINASPDDEGLDRPLDAERVLRIALAHDLAEALMTDLPKRSSHLLGTDVKHQAERRAMEYIEAELPAGFGYAALWEEYESATTPEAQIVRDADKLEMALQAAAYGRALGSTTLDEFQRGHVWHFSLPARVAASLRDGDPAHTEGRLP